MARLELLRKAELERDADCLRDGVRVLSEALLELEVTQHVGAERHERSPERTGQRNGYRERSWDTRVGTIELRVPRLRDGSFYPALLEPRKRAERAPVAVVQEAYVQGCRLAGSTTWSRRSGSAASPRARSAALPGARRRGGAVPDAKGSDLVQARRSRPSASTRVWPGPLDAHSIGPLRRSGVSRCVR